MATEEIVEGSKVWLERLITVRDVQTVIRRYERGPGGYEGDVRYLVGIVDLGDEERVISREFDSPEAKWRVEWTASHVNSGHRLVYWIAEGAS